MKKIRLTALMLSAVIALSACGGNTANIEKKSSVTQNTFASQASSAKKSSASMGSTSSAASNTNSETKTAGTHTVVDHGGNTVEVPNEINRIVIDQIPILSTYMAYFEGSAPKLVGFAGSFKDIITKTALKNIAPELFKSSDTVYAQSDLNIEEIIKLKPDVIFYNAQNKEHAEILKKSGIPAVGFATIGASTPADPIERYKEWLRLLEDVFGEKGKMDNFIAEGDKIVADVTERIAKVDEKDRPDTMILWKYANGVPMVAGKGSFGDFWLQRLKVKNLAGETKGFAQVSMEQIYKWNPSLLFLDGPGLLDMIPSDVMENKVEGADFSTIKAVKDKRVYNTTLGMWNWFTPNPDGPLVLAWLASRTYPEQFKDYPLEDTIRKYYKDFYGYDVTDEEMKGMLDYNER